MAQYTPNDPMAKPMLVGGLVLIGFVVFILISNLVHTIQKNSLKGEIDTTSQNNAADVILAPIGTVTTVDKSVVKPARTGEAIFTAVCTSCHSAGVLGAPKVDDKAAWEPRTAQGLDTLVKNATNGIRSMPARGGDPTLTDEEITNAVVYMTGKAGIDLSSQVKKTAGAAAAPAGGSPAPAAVPAASGNGEKTYKATCAMCHEAGLAGAPKLGDKAAWDPRIATGIETLHNSALKGKNAMPAKGGNPALSDDDVKAAVDYMVAQAGGAAAAPAPAAPAPAAAPAAAAPAAGGNGEKTYKAVCAMCHEAGLAGAPKFGDKAAWAPRIATGMDALHTSALKGKNAMPAKGGNPAIADDDVKAAVDYMVNASK